MTDALRKATQKQAAQKLDDFLARFDVDAQERIIRYALDHIVPRMKRPALSAPAPMAVAEWDYNDDKVFVRKPGEDWREAKPSEIVSALNAAPVAVQAVPLTDHQLASMYANTAPAMTPMDYYIAGIRDAERAHGIKQPGSETP